MLFDGFDIVLLKPFLQKNGEEAFPLIRIWVKEIVNKGKFERGGPILKMNRKHIGLISFVILLALLIALKIGGSVFYGKIHEIDRQEVIEL